MPVAGRAGDVSPVPVGASGGAEARARAPRPRAPERRGAQRHCARSGGKPAGQAAGSRSGRRVTCRAGIACAARVRRRGGDGASVERPGVTCGRSARDRAAEPGRCAGRAGRVRGGVACAAGQRGAAWAAGRARSNAGDHPRRRRARLPATSTGTGRRRPRRCACARRRSGRGVRRSAASPPSAASFRRTLASPTRLWGRRCEKRRSQIPGATMLRRCTVSCVWGTAGRTLLFLVGSTPYGVSFCSDVPDCLF